MDKDEDTIGTNLRSTERDRRPTQNDRAVFPVSKYPEARQVYLHCHQGAVYRTKKGRVFVQAEFEEKVDNPPPPFPGVR